MLRVSMVVFLPLLLAAAVSRPATVPASPNPKAYSVGERLFGDSFNDLSQWKAELEKGGTVEAKGGMLEINVPRGCSVWFRHELSGPVMIEYEARIVKGDLAGPNDRVSDLNCFWMATDPRNEKDFFDVPARNGTFATYNELKTYYVGQGGNTNRTTRFRRYIGDATNRPLLPEHDLTAKRYMLTPNVWQKVQVVACGPLIEYYRDGQRIFSYTDAHPYTHGYFAIRTTFNHMEVRDFAVYRLKPAE
ncbi:MAG TPA: DUF6250 domain-containing protein [Phycisphaerae bacterium]|nr:DUF6250 domain-containing protein [Phycisphaerae bacterium]